MTVLDQAVPAPKGTIYRYRKVKYGLVLLFLAGLTVVSLLALVVVPGVAIKLVGLVVVSALGLLLWLQISYLFLPDNLVVIDEHGIWDHRISDDPVPWHVIRRAYRKSSVMVASIEHVYLELSDPGYHQRLPLPAIGRLLGIQPRNAHLLVINPACLTGNAESILTTIRSFRPEIVTCPPDPLGPEASVEASEAAGYRSGAATLEVFRNRKTLAIVLAANLTFMAFLAVLLSTGPRQWIIVILMLAGTAFFALWLLHQLVVSKPVLAIDGTGVTFRDIGSRTVPWRDVQDIKVSNWLIAVEEKTPDTPKPGPLAAIFSNTDPAILAIALTASKADIRAAIAHFRTQASEASSSRR